MEDLLKMWMPMGLIFEKHHAQLPTPIYIGEGKIRLYYSTKINKKSQINFIDICEKTLKVLSDPQTALLHGINGSFDHAGVMPSCINSGKMFYSGWYLRHDVPYGHAIGVASIMPDGTLVKKNGPILDRNYYEPFLVNSPFVEKKRNLWKMYYCSGTGWHDGQPTYNIKKATSKDGKMFLSKNKTIITYENQKEAISRICKFENLFYYSYKINSKKYKIAFQNKIGTKKDLIFQTSKWDSEMQCYPYIYKRKKIKYLFYNGNGYGETGIGALIWKLDTD